MKEPKDRVLRHSTTPRAERSLLFNVNMARSMAAHGALYSGAALELFSPHPSATGRDLVIGGLALWAAGLPLREHLNARTKAAAGQAGPPDTLTRRELQ